MTHMQMVNGSLFMKERQEALLIELEPIAITFFKKGIQSIYDHVKKNNKIRRFILKEFQYALKNISNWSTEVKELEWVRFKNISNKNIEKIIQGIFKVHSIILKGFKDDNVAPTGLDYMYECYLNIARYLWKDPFLLYDIGVNENEVHKKMKEFEKVIAKLARNTFVEMIKVDPIDIDDEEAVADDEGSSDSEFAFNSEEAAVEETGNVDDSQVKVAGSSRLSEGDVSEGDESEGDVSEGDVSEGDVSEGDVFEGDVSEGDVCGGDVSEGDVSEGDVCGGDVSEGDVSEGDESEGDVSERNVSERDVDKLVGDSHEDATPEEVEIPTTTKVVDLSPKKDDKSDEEVERPETSKNIRVVNIESMNLLEKKRRVKQLLMKSNKDSFF